MRRKSKSAAKLIGLPHHGWCRFLSTGMVCAHHAPWLGHCCDTTDVCLAPPASSLAMRQLLHAEPQASQSGSGLAETLGSADCVVLAVATAAAGEVCRACAHGMNYGVQSARHQAAPSGRTRIRRRMVTENLGCWDWI